jgi:staphylococcal nuclease domain-containing protein 1
MEKNLIHHPTHSLSLSLSPSTWARLASTKTPVDEGDAFPAREWLRQLVVGKWVRFETTTNNNKKSSTTNATTTTATTTTDRVYGCLFLIEPANVSEGKEETKVNLAVECVRMGHATPKSIKYSKGNVMNENDTTTNPNGDTGTGSADGDLESSNYEALLLKAYKEAVEMKRGIHGPHPVVRHIKNAGEDFVLSTLVELTQKVATQKRITCVIEHCLDGCRFRCQVTDTSFHRDYLYANFTLQLAGTSCPRFGNPKADPPTTTEPLANEARNFVTARLLQRELSISLYGTDKNGYNAVGTIHHPAGNIAVELLKVGYGKVAEWTVRMMPPAEVPPLRIAENTAKRTGLGVWHSYAPPVLSSASQIRGTVVEVISGDTIAILPLGKLYDSDQQLMKLSLASIRAPRVGSTVAGRTDEPFAIECKERLRTLVIGKTVDITVHYERDIPIRPGENEKRSFGTVSCGKYTDVAETLVSEGLAVAQQHRDDDEKSPRYDEIRAAEATAKAAKKNVHMEKVVEQYKRTAINDLTDPRKAKAYSGSLMRAGNVKAVVDYVFNGSLFKLYVPAENCYIRFTPNYIRCPQPSPSPGSKQPTKGAEPFGDAAKFHARLNVLQRSVEISCTGVTNSGILLGSMYTGYGAQRTDYTIELLGAGLASLDQRKVEYNEVPKTLIDAQNIAKANKVGLWSLEQPKTADTTMKTNEKFTEKVLQGRLSEIRSGNHFFYHLLNDTALPVMDESMALFTKNNGTAGGPCDVKVGKVVAALFDDGTGKKWYRGKIIEKKGNTGKVGVLFVDYGNVATVPVSTHLRPLDMTLGIDRIPPVAHEAVLALTTTRSVDSDYGIDAARMLQGLCWGKDLVIRTLAPNEDNGKMAVTVTVSGSDETVNAQLISEGLARAGKPASVESLASRMATASSSAVVQLGNDLMAAEQVARKSRCGMWRYGDIGDEDPDEL